MMRPMIVQDAGDKHGNKIKWSIPQHKALCSMLCRGFKNQIKYNRSRSTPGRSTHDTRKTGIYVSDLIPAALWPLPPGRRARRALAPGVRGATIRIHAGR